MVGQLHLSRVIVKSGLLVASTDEFNDVWDGDFAIVLGNQQF